MSPATPTPLVTFYSFKGGVGRSMALVNAACILAGRGFRVLAVDMDLEAPGLSYMVPDDQPGVVELLLDAAEDGVEADLFKLERARVIERYCVACTIPKAMHKNDGGSFYVMPAGKKDAGYQSRLNKLALGELYQDGLGLGLMQHFKRVLQESDAFDLIFIDSRTGFSDESGVCTRDLADHLVVLFGLNRQNIEGTVSFLAALRAAKVDHPLRLVVSPVPPNEEERVEERVEVAAKAMKAVLGAAPDLSLRIPYHPRLALSEDPHLFRWTRSPIFDAYLAIQAAILTMIGITPNAIKQQVEAAARSKDVPAVIAALRLLTRLEEGRSTLEGLVYTDLEPLWSPPEGGLLRAALAEILPPDSWVVGHLGAELHKSKNEDAGHFYKRALAADPQNAINLGNYATFLWKVRGDHDMAEQLYQRALVADPKHVNNLGNYASFLTDVRGNHDAAEQHYQRALAADPKNANNLGNYAKFLTNVRGNHDAAEQHYERALAADPRHALHLGNYANFLLRVRGDHDAAEQHYQRALAVDPKHVNNLGNYASFLTSVRGNHDAAEQHYQRALAADPHHANHLGNYALFLTEVRGNHDAAEQHYERALAADPKNANTLWNYADFLRTVRGNHDAAEQHYERALAADPKNANTLGNYANFLTDVRGSHDAAEQHYERALAADPKNANTLGNYAKLLYVQGRTEEARDRVAEALAAAPGDVVRAELLFYQYAHEAEREAPLKALRALLEAGVRSPGWPLDRNVAAAVAAGHPEPEFLGRLAKVLTDQLPLSALGPKS